ncbi:hypothetical protein Pmani_003558 [Petrolisthes manimaculis]|uniref:SAM domain-containing protein n=1 Tax=Petrolisthes manimaculis TaxID=1843537 RepID=A0AAE1QID1_9EUCA|nr:hypothetical protein Pmani_003558 [Petrolisthes manimaculis]
MSCASFLVNFGVNIWATDNEYHTAKDLAAMNNRNDILRFLDSVSANHNMSDPKGAKKQQEKAQKDSDKRRKDFDKIQKKAEKKREEENIKLQRERERIEKIDEKPQPVKKGIMNTISRGSLSLLNGPRKDSRALSENTTNSPKFSDLTTTAANNKKTMSGIQKKIIRKKVMEEHRGNTDFKVGKMESDGKKSVRNLSGLRRDSEIMFVPNGSVSSSNSESPGSGKRGKIADVFEQDEDGEDSSDFFLDGQNKANQGSLFARPGFGSVAFRNNSITATLSSLGASGSGSESPHASSTSSLAHREPIEPWEEEDLPSDDESDATPMYMFLASAGLVDFIPTFAKEHIDLDALVLLTEEDLVAMKLPIGPRRKLLKAIENRKTDLENPGEVQDSKL